MAAQPVPHSLIEAGRDVVGHGHIGHCHESHVAHLDCSELGAIIITTALPHDYALVAAPTPPSPHAEHQSLSVRCVDHPRTGRPGRSLDRYRTVVRRRPESVSPSTGARDREREERHIADTSGGCAPRVRGRAVSDTAPANALRHERRFSDALGAPAGRDSRTWVEPRIDRTASPTSSRHRRLRRARRAVRARRSISAQRVRRSPIDRRRCAVPGRRRPLDVDRGGVATRPHPFHAQLVDQGAQERPGDDRVEVGPQAGSSSRRRPPTRSGPQRS